MKEKKLLPSLFLLHNSNDDQNLKTNPGNDGITNKVQAKSRLRLLQNIQNVYGEKRDPLFFLPIPLLYCSWKKVGFFAIRQNVDIKGS